MVDDTELVTPTDEVKVEPREVNPISFLGPNGSHPKVTKDMRPGAIKMQQSRDNINYGGEVPAPVVVHEEPPAPEIPPVEPVVEPKPPVKVAEKKTAAPD